MSGRFSARNFPESLCPGFKANVEVGRMEEGGYAGRGAAEADALSRVDAPLARP